MKSRSFSRVLSLVLPLLAASLLCGCSIFSAARPPYNITVQPGDSLKGSSVQVDLVGINYSELERWRTKSVGEYFKPGDPLRADAAKFSITNLEQGVVLWRTNSIWNNWLKAAAPDQYIVVLADLPGRFPEGQAGSQDPRRQILPLTKKAWSGGDIDIQVRGDGVKVNTVQEAGFVPPGW